MARVTRIQALSGLAFALFLSLHLLTTTSAVAGGAAYDGTLGALRRLYRPTLALEVVLIGVPAVVHVACALVQIAGRWRRGRREGITVHRLAGYVLLAAIGGHVFATRVMPAAGAGPADYSYLAYSLLNWPLFMRPYYVVLGAAGAVHLVLGLAVAARVLGFGVRAPRAAVAGAVLVTGLVVAGVLGIIAGAAAAPRGRFAEYRALCERFIPFLPPRL